VNTIILFLALIAFISDHGTVTWFGTIISQLIDAGCNEMGESADCWKHSVSATGSGAAVLVYLFLRLCIKATSSMKDSLPLIGPRFMLSHLLVSVTLSFALLGHLGTFSWAERLSEHYIYPRFSAGFHQVGVLAIVLWVSIVFVESIRTMALQSKLRRLSQLGRRPIT
jgi:hypothetical protein